LIINSLGGHILGGGKSLAGVQGPKIIMAPARLLGKSMHRALTVII